MKIIAFIGLPLSGKSTAAKVAAKLGIPVIVMGDIVRKEVRRRGLELNDKNAGMVANDLREKEGMDAIAKRCIPLIKSLEEDIVVIDGVRGIAEVERFKEEFGNDFILINVSASIEKRLERAVRRKREDDIKTLEELENRDERELSWNMGRAIEMAEYTVDNNSGYSKFTEKIEELINQLSKHVNIRITTLVYPTEDEEKVMAAIRNLFPDAEIVIRNGVLTAKAENLHRIRELLRKQKILDTARSEFLKGIRNNSIIVYINKQIATASKINFTDENAVLSPLCVEFRIRGIDIERFIDYLAPPTKDGKPIMELDEL
jgi:predicted RNA binding protein with dsRBD fold (UPF0201 family)/cytidylate kinase